MKQVCSAKTVRVGHVIRCEGRHVRIVEIGKKEPHRKCVYLCQCGRRVRADLANVLSLKCPRCISCRNKANRHVR
jgi:hypothetical protein